MSDDTFICYAREDMAFALKVAEGLKGRDIPVWVDKWNIEPGTDWDRAIEETLRSCANVVIILSPAAVTSNEVRGELRTALNGEKFIVPLLYQPCEIPRQIQHLQYVDFSGSDSAADEALRDLASVLSRRAPVQPDAEDARPRSPSRFRARAYTPERELRNRRDVLEDVKGEAADRLRQTLNSDDSLVILIEKQPHQLARPWDESIKTAFRPRSVVPAAIGIVEAFDGEGVAGRLLILGAPGSGKTTALLQLAHELTRRADANPAEPIPMLLNLSSWRDDSQTFSAWLVEQLKRKYGVRHDYGRKWLDERDVALMLDGLDELPPARHEDCVRAINQFQQDFRPKSLVVCCRLAEYENVTVKLQLNGAICLLPLGDEQIHEYLVRSGCAGVWQGIGLDLESMDLARSPLLLRMMTVAYGELSPDDWKRLASPSERREYLLAAYTQHLLSRDTTGGGYEKGQTLAWLARLAAVLAREGHEEFLLERMQPRWLQSAAERWVYRVGVTVSVGLVFVLAVALTDLLTDWAPQSAMNAKVRQAYPAIILSPAADLGMKTLIGLAIGAFVASRKTIVPIETVRWSWANAWLGTTHWLGRTAAAAMGYGLHVGLVVGLIVAARNTFGTNSLWSGAVSGWVKSGLIAGAAVSLMFCVALEMLPKPSAGVTQWFRTRLTTRGADALMSGLVVGVGGSIAYGPGSGAVSGVSVALIAGLSRGLTPSSAAHFVRGLMVGLAGCTGIAWQLARASPARPLKDWLVVWLSVGLGVGVTAGCVSAIWTRIRPAGDAVDATGTAVNTASWLFRRWRRWLLFGIVAAASVVAVCTALARLGRMPVVRGVAVSANYLSVSFSAMLAMLVVSALTVGFAMAIMGGFLGALYGLLQGITGPDVQRRTVANQGIRQSAANIAAFGLIGMLAVGFPYGLLNVGAAAVSTGMAPGPSDWWRLGLGSAVPWAVIGGLVPGAACIQHFTLRFVLWCYGIAPWRYVRFLNYATDQLLLQRVGGRYRFLHVLLRDHFAGIELPMDAGVPGSRSYAGRLPS